MANSQTDYDLPEVPVPGSQLKVPELSDERMQLLRELSMWFKEQNFPETPDAYLVKFLHSCDYDLKKAKACAKDFHYSRREMPEMFQNLDISLPSLKSIFEILRLSILPRKTPGNHRIVMTSISTSDTTNFVVPDVTKALIMAVDSIFMTEPIIDGVIFLHDIELVTFTHFVKTAWYMPRKLQPYFQAGLPLKQHSAHVLHCSSIVDRATRLLKSICRKEDWDRTRFYRGDDFSELHKFIPKDCLPSDLGGTLPSVQELHEMTIQRMVDFKDVLE